jgi:NCS1 family nucleobase:cation symporter-1
MGALGGILIADYWILRRQQLRLADLFRENGIYSYSNGINPRAMVALALSIAPVVPGFIRAAMTPGGIVANPGFLDQLYSYAWFVTFALSLAIYSVLMRGRATEPAVQGAGSAAPSPAPSRG